MGVGPLFGEHIASAEGGRVAIFQAFCQGRGESYLRAEPFTIRASIEHEVKGGEEAGDGAAVYRNDRAGARRCGVIESVFRGNRARLAKPYRLERIEAAFHPLDISVVATDPGSMELYRGLIAHAGSYSIDGHQITHHIEASWNQAWTGTTQVSQFNIAESTLYIRTGISKSPMTGRPSSTVFIWARVE